MQKTFIRTLSLLLIYWSCSPAAIAQERAIVSGQITDEKNAPVRQAVVRLVNRLTSQAQETRSDEQGQFRFSEVRGGSYLIEASTPGFELARSKPFAVSNGETRALNQVLRVARVREQIVVSASRRDELMSEVAAPTTVIDRQEIEDSATQTLEQLLIEQAGSGVYVSRSFGIGFPAINGISGNRVLTLVDGQRQIGTDNGTRDGIDIDQYPTERIDRVEVVKGASSALYGSDAMGGVINLISRRPEKPFSFDFNNSYGSFGERNLGATMGFKHGRWGGLMSGVYQSFDGYDLNPANAATTGFSGGENGFIDRQLAPALFYDATGAIKLKARSNYYRRNSYFLGATGQFTSQTAQERWNVAPAAEFILGSRTVITARGDVSVARRFDQDRVETLGQFESFGSSVLTRANQLQYGFETRQKKLRRPGLGDEDDITVPLGARGVRTIRVNSFWMHDEQRLFKNRLTIAAGFRVEDNSQFGNNVSPKASALFAVTEKHRVRFAYGEGFRAPDVSELYLGFSPGSFAFVGNPKLTPEESRSYSLGYSFFSARMQYALDLFYNRFENGIGFDQVNLSAPLDPFFNQFIPRLAPGQQLFTNRNLGDFDARGLNSSLNVALGRGFTTTFNYTLLERVTVNPGNPASDGQRQIGLGNVRNSAFLKFGWSGAVKIGERRIALRTNLRGLMRGREPVQTTTTASRPVDPSRVGQIEFVPSYQTWDFYGAAEFPVSESRFTIQPFFGINNLGDFRGRGFVYADRTRVTNQATDPTLPVFRDPGRVFQGGFRLRFGR